MSEPTWILAVATVILAVATFWLAFEARRGSIRQIGVQTWLSLQERFDSPEVKWARALLAEQCSPYNPSKHDEMSETVMELFESIGTVYNEGLINKKLASSTFSWFATRWWEAVKPYIDEERRRQDDDQTLFEEFEKFASHMRKHDPKIPSVDLSRFLANEKRLLSGLMKSAKVSGSGVKAGC